MKRGRNTERHSEHSTVESKFGMKSFRPSSCIFMVTNISKRYGKDHVC